MNNAPKWFTPVSVVALLWNLLGCAAFLADLMITPEALAKMDEAQQAMYAARPAWTLGATGLAVLGGALGCLGLILRKRWAFPVLVLSLVGVIVQDAVLFGMSAMRIHIAPPVYILQGLVLLIAIGLVFMARKALKNEWLS